MSSIPMSTVKINGVVFEISDMYARKNLGLGGGGGNGGAEIVIGTIVEMSAEDMSISGTADKNSAEIKELFADNKNVVLMISENAELGITQMVAEYDAFASAMYEAEEQSAAVFTSVSFVAQVMTVFIVAEDGTMMGQVMQLPLMPPPTADDAGKFLRVNADGMAEWQSILTAEGVSF